MFPNGLVILTQPVSALRSQIPRLLEQVSSVISDTVYIHLQPALRTSGSLHTSLLSPLACTADVETFISDVYGLSSTRCQNLDIRILLAHITNRQQVSAPKYRLKKPLSVLMSDAPSLVDSWNFDRASIVQLLQETFSEGIHADMTVQRLDTNAADNSPHKEGATLTTYDYVVLGGTFDRLHLGHNLLLSRSCLLCEKEVTVGVTSEDMNAKKTLRELILPQEERMAGVREFIADIKPNIKPDIVSINDVYGPTIHRAEFECMVLSQETTKGGSMVNEQREKTGLKQLELVTIDLVEDTCRAPEEEEKVSSSSQRRRLLGTLLRPPVPKPDVPPRPYRIGLTGGIASGKSNMCKELATLGAGVVNCDLLGHKAYEPGTEGFKAVVSEFGDDLITEKGDVDRKKLGSIVFSDKSKLEKLNSIVWPEIMKLAEKEMKQLAVDGVTVVVLEAAVLFEAGWDKSVHEVWTTFVPREEAIQRVLKRNQLSEEEAAKRLDSQLANKERIAKSNVVICPLWEFEYTRKQIQKAWDLLQQRLPPSSSL
ncbi:bifunctional coenzyme A synthase-like [Littorina saxatilis]|uniref:Bifunctional coenzyme A synthase n=1 Tax=Littorina saxatilis TaxID=31220 RepID=A0AAN9BQP7_9CAEN